MSSYSFGIVFRIKDPVYFVGICFLSGRKKIPSTLLGSFGWSKNYIGMSQINRRKFNLIFYI